MVAKTADEFRAKHDPATIIARLEAELREANKQSADAQALKEALGTVAAKFDILRPPVWTAKASKPSAPGVPTLFLSDLHWGEVVYGAQVNGVNTYNLAIARDRLRYTVETAIQLLRIIDKDMNYPGIVVPLGGDMISGDIHEELKESNDLPTIPTVLDLFEHLVGAIKLLADTFGAVFLPCVTGNHGRNTRKIYAKNRHHTSFDWMLYQLLAKHFSTLGDTRVTFFIPDGPDALFKIYETRYLLTHGDQFRAGDSIIGPLGPLMRGNQKKLARNEAVNQAYDLMMVGHWHFYAHLAHLIVNGAMKGYDEFAASQNYGFEKPSQSMWITHQRHGQTYRAPVYCDAGAPVTKSAWVSMRAA